MSLAATIAKLDERAAAGGLSSVMLYRVGGAWQAMLQSAATGSHAVMRKATPSEALDAALAMLPISEKFDVDNGLAKPVEEKPAAGVFD